MEIEENNIETREDLNESDTDNQPVKRMRKFHAKEFRDNLKTSNGFASIKEFVHLCMEEKTKQDYALQFLESGGSLTEVLRFLDTFEKKNAKDALPIFQAFNIILLKMLSKRPDKLLSCEEICREFLVKYYPFIKSMLSLNSTTKQRKVALKLLSTMTTMSTILAKDILAYAAFDPAVLEILVNPGMGDDQSSVRTGFIHFLLSFLVDGNTPIITTFLEKKGLLTSLFPGLLYDKYETIELVLSTIKEKILEDKRLSKTVKMNTFNTNVVKNLVNLYNWKGPLSRKSGNLKKRMSQPQQIDPVEKNKVCQCVHQFLLILCTSKFGVIFRDPTIGLSGKVHNNLMLTVLQGLGKPWDHHLASELVTKICLVCPDLVKPVLSEVAPFLEPRVSKKWLNAIRFVKNLIESLTPDYLGQYFEKLNIKQINMIMQNLFVPKNILQITVESLNHEYLTIKYEVLNLLLKMVQTASSYISFVDKQLYFTTADKLKLKELLSQYLETNLPPVNVLMQVWNEGPNAGIMEDPDVPFPNLTSNLSLILDILYECYKICPPLVEDLTNQINTVAFLQKIESMENENDSLRDDMFVKSINLFLLSDFSSFLPTTEIFSNALPLLLKIYLETDKKVQIEKTLFELLKNTGIFDGCYQEIQIWLNSFLEINFDENVAQFFITVVKLTYQNYVEYCKEISDVRKNVAGENVLNYKALIETLSMDIYTQNNENINNYNVLSPLVIGLLNSSLENKNFSTFVNVSLAHLLHLQTAPQILFSIVFNEKYSTNLDKNLVKYFNKWNHCESLVSLKKVYNSKNSLTKLCKFLIDTTVEENFANFAEFHYYQLFLSIKMSIFYYTQLAKTKQLDETIQNKYLGIIFELLRSQKSFEILDAILKNPVLIQFFSPIRKDDPTQNLTTDFVIKIIEKLTETSSKNELETYLNNYRTILIRQIYVMLERAKKHRKAPKTNFISIVQLFELNLEQCVEMLKMCSNLPSEALVTPENTISVVVELISYCLNRNLQLSVSSSKFINNDTMKNLGQQLLFLNNFGVEINFEMLETILFNYIRQFPHLLESFNDDIYKSLLLKTNVTKYTCRLAMQMLKCDRDYFKTILDNLDLIIDKRELIFSLLYATIDLDLPNVDNFYQKVYAKHEQVILKVLNKPQKVAQYLVEYYQVLIKIVQNYISDGVCNDFCLKTQKFDVSEAFHFEIITSVFDRTVKNVGSKSRVMSNYINTAMVYILNMLKKQERNDDDNKKLDDILKIFCYFLNKNAIEYTDVNLATNATFQSFSKSCLKFGLQGNPLLVETLRRLSEFCSNEEYLGMLFEMAVSHSETLNIILDSSNPTKSILIHLLYVLCQKYPSVMSKNHIPVWLGAYEGTLSSSDQYLLKLMSLYEQTDIGFHEFKPYLWGKVAVGHYSVKFGVEMSLWRQPKPSEVLDIFDLEKIKLTLTNFPKSRSLNPEQSFCNESNLNVYDPAFYLPLFSQLLAPESTIKWYQCKFGAVALVTIALTSDENDVRVAACHVLARFHYHLEAARFGKDRLLWLHFVEALCRAASTLENLHLSSIGGLFMARCALIFNRPDHSLYTALTKYIMAKESPDLTYVPELLELLHSTDVKFIEHRNFILEVMRDGLRDNNDLKIMYRSMSFKFLMDIYNSVVMNHEGKRLILEIITSAVSITTGARILTSNHGLMSWLLITVQNFNQNDSNLLSATINLIKKLYLALETDQNLLQYSKFGILFSLVTMINSFDKIRISKDDIAKFVEILYILYNDECKLLSRNNLDTLLNTSAKYFDSNICKYYLAYENKYVEPIKVATNSLEEKTLNYLKLLTLKWLDVNKS